MIFALLTALVFLVAPAEAATINAGNVSLASVQAAVNSASSGDTVVIPSGTATWVSTLIITKDINLIGAGIGQTTITDETVRVGGTSSLVSWTVGPSGYPRLSGFTFAGGTVNTAIGYSGLIAIGGSCPTLRVDHCKFNYADNNGIVIQGAIYGVIDHCQFLQNWANGVEVYDTSYGDPSWATPVQWGGTNFVCIENCSFYYPGYPSPAPEDMFAGAKIVFRYNNVTNEFFQDHGLETSGRLRSGRAVEVYENNFIENVYQWAGTVFELRGGTGVIFSNTVSSNYKNFLDLQNFRSAENFSPWGSGNGQNLWDSNNPSLLASGTHTGTNGSPVLVNASASWSANQWVGGYEVQDTTQGGTNNTSTTTTFSLITANDAHVITTISGHLGQMMNWNNGDHYAIYQSYRQMDQIGAGSGDLVSGGDSPVNSTTGNPTWTHEISEPLYVWGNTFNGAANYAVGQTGYNIIQLNRDYYNGVKPAYTPLVYPHLLTAVHQLAPPTGFAVATNAP